MAHVERKKRPLDEHLVTLLQTADPPTREEYAVKKVELARKMDRLEFVSKARMKFIKNLHENNEKKVDAILCRPPGKLAEVSKQGLVQADALFETLKQDALKKKSIPKRLDIVHNYCVHLEVQQSRGMQTPDQMDPLPSPELFQDINFMDMNPTYTDLLNNEPSPFKPADGATRDPLLAVCLLQPYTPPPQIVEAQQRAKARAVEQVAEQKRIEKLLARKEKERFAALTA
ncbi:unnamed protein product [Amoebophrya sp. A120]|nr:unnamed protein product [Amoebophrya sp. A120]|eukprot:GSA120T00025222001.1